MICLNIFYKDKCKDWLYMNNIEDEENVNYFNMIKKYILMK